MAKIVNRQQRNKNIGTRLSECMKLKKKTAADLKKAADKLSGGKIPPSYISQVLSGSRGLSTERAILFAKALKVKAGYLLADDDFFAKTYKEYCSDSDVDAVVQKLTMLFEPTEYYVQGVSIVDDEIVDYDICSGDVHATIPAKAMDSFLNLINQTVNLEMAHFCDIYGDTDSLDIKAIDDELQNP